MGVVLHDFLISAVELIRINQCLSQTNTWCMQAIIFYVLLFMLQWPCTCISNCNIATKVL